MSIVWYTGIVVNGLLVLSFSYFVLLVVQLHRHTQQSELRRKRLAVTIGLIGTLSVNLSLLFLYLQMGIIQHDISVDETFLPLLFLIGYQITLLSISMLIWLEYYPEKKSGLVLILGQAAISMIAVIFSSDYTIFWNEGAVLVVLGPISDTITLWLGLAIGTVFLYLALEKRLDEISDETPDRVSPKSSKLLLVALINFAQFLIPRAEAGSIVDPFSVKFIGFIVTIGFGYTLLLYSRTDDSLVEATTLEHEQQSIGPSLKQLSVAVILAILFNLALQNQQNYGTGIEWRKFLQSQSLFVGHWFNTNLYFNYFAVVIPLVCLMVAFVLLNISPQYKQVLLDRQGYSWLLLTAILQVSIFLLAHLQFIQNGSDLSQINGQTILPLIIAPIIAGIILLMIGKCRNGKLFSFTKDRPTQITRIVYLFGISFLAAFCVDVIVTLPPFSEPMNYVFIGAAGLIDGLLWAPVMAVVAYEMILSLREIL